MGMRTYMQKPGSVLVRLCSCKGDVERFWWPLDESCPSEECSNGFKLPALKGRIRRGYLCPTCNDFWPEKSDADHCCD